ncbi:MAG: L-threonine 3-dehydrogenase [Planctomycetota bacterium]|nr:MAG: L-threonine 3-dehydrogenase [Planctomycetota bacterium]
MRAIQMARPEPGAAVYVEDLPVPTPGEGEVRVRIARAAICGTDRHIFHWDPSVAPMLSPPVVIGHEFCGHIDALGPGVEGWQEGDYVSAEMHLVCGRCRACRSGNRHVCEHTRIAGLHRDGAFAEYVVVPAANLVRLDPAVVPPHIGAFLDALGNAVHTVQAASSIAGRHVLLSGYGAIGAMAAAVVEFEGAASLTITEVAPGHLERARAWAAARADSATPIRVLDPGRGGLVEEVRATTDGGVDVVLEMSGAPAAINSGLELLYPAGEMVLLGIPSRPDLLVEDFSRRIIFKGLTLRGVVGRRMFATWEEMLGLLARGLDLEHIVTHRLPLRDFHRGVALLDAAEAHKVVLDPAQTD